MISSNLCGNKANIESMNSKVRALLDAWDIQYYYYLYESPDNKVIRHMYSFIGTPYVVEVSNKLLHRTHKERLQNAPQYLFRWSPKTSKRTIKQLEKIILEVLL